MKRLIEIALALIFLAPAACARDEEPQPEPTAEADPTAKPEPKAAPAPEPAAEPAPAPDPIEAARREPVQGPIPAPPNVKKPPKDARITEAGVYYEVLEPGTGKTSPKTTSTVTVHYTGWRTNGKMFDSSLKSGEPATFRLDGVIAGWTDALQYMVVGEKARFWIPEKLAYQGKPGRPAGMLVFDIELIDFQ